MWLTRQPPSPEVEAGPFPRPFVLKTRSLASAGAPRRDRPRRWAFMQADRYGQSKAGRTSFDVGRYWLSGISAYVAKHISSSVPSANTMYFGGRFGSSERSHEQLMRIFWPAFTWIGFASP